MERVVVLRDLGSSRVVDPFGQSRGHGDESFLATPEVSVEVEETDHAGRHELARDPQVVALCPSMPTTLIQPRAATDAASGAANWALAAVHAEGSAWSGRGTVVAVLDTGIDRAHPAFEGVDIVERDFSGDGDGDRAGHGTHCAGTAFGRDVGPTRIGVARGVEKALVGKILGDTGRGTSEMAFDGIQWAVAEGAHVVSMSLGFDFPGLVRRRTDDGWPVELATSSALEAYRGNLRMFDALMGMVQAQAAFSAGTLFVAAAGNESKRDENPNFEIAASLPAAAQDVVSVAALSRHGERFSVAPFSNTFATVAAPGVDIVSAKPGGGLTTMSGTSMACPHVAGLAALWHEALRAAGLPPTAKNVTARLLASARPDVFTDDTDQVDVGVGLAMAPV